MTTSRVARKPIPLPSGVQLAVNDKTLSIKGTKGEIKWDIPECLNVDIKENEVQVVISDLKHPNGNALAGTIASILANSVKGVHEGYVVKLKLVGVGYRAQLGKAKNGNPKLDLTLGLSHPVSYVAPEGIDLKTPSATEIEVIGFDKQVVGQAAANIRGIRNGIRKPEPYKGKGIRYADEVIILKETKKK